MAWSPAARAAALKARQAKSGAGGGATVNEAGQPVNLAILRKAGKAGKGTPAPKVAKPKAAPKGKAPAKPKAAPKPKAAAKPKAAPKGKAPAKAAIPKIAVKANAAHVATLVAAAKAKAGIPSKPAPTPPAHRGVTTKAAKRATLKGLPVHHGGMALHRAGRRR